MQSKRSSREPRASHVFYRNGGVSAGILHRGNMIDLNDILAATMESTKNLIAVFKAQFDLLTPKEREYIIQ